MPHIEPTRNSLSLSFYGKILIITCTSVFNKKWARTHLKTANTPSSFTTSTHVLDATRTAVCTNYIDLQRKAVKALFFF